MVTISNFRVTPVVGWIEPPLTLAPDPFEVAEVFEVPCVAFAPSLRAIEPLGATGAEFIALADVVWSHADGPAEAIRLALAMLGGIATCSYFTP